MRHPVRTRYRNVASAAARHRWAKPFTSRSQKSRPETPDRQPCVRNRSDALVRYGGDEFLLIFPHIPEHVFIKRLEQIRALMTEAREHPEFDCFIEENDEVRQSIEEAFNRDFDVYVVATMSSGKSTLINAMLGHDLLPAANEATTATIARITDND